MITLLNIVKQFGTKVLYDNISVSINPENKTGFIGPNGAGKSVLLKILTGEEEADTGTVTIPSNLKIGYLPQEMEIELSDTPLELTLMPFKKLFETEAVIEKLSSSGDTSSAKFSRAAEKYDKLQADMHMHDVFSLPSRAKRILSGLGVPQDSCEQPMQQLSGGFKMRVILAQLLLTEPDFLLLDEPTNHLDMDSLIWLEKFLQKFRGGTLIVSHDRDFLNRTTAHTIEIRNGIITRCKGNINRFLAWKSECIESEMRRMKNIQAKIQQNERFITRFKSKNTKSSQAQSRIKQVEKLKKELPPGHKAIKTIRFELPKPQKSGSIPLKLENITVAYDNNTVLKDLSLTVNRGDKIAIIGPNGAGKTTLLRACSGMIFLQEGKRLVGYNTTIKYFSQQRLDQLNPDKNLYDTVAGASTDLDRTGIQSILGAFLFIGDEALKKAGVLSGGEKSRLSLCTLLASPGNLLLLDEPTNHLDIESIERLSKALKNFNGTFLIVSHDEYFISSIANRIIELRPGRYRDFPGNLTDYRSYIEEGYISPFEDNAAKSKTGTINQASMAKKERIKKRRERIRIERTIKKIEKKIEKVELEIEETKTVLHAPANARNYELLDKENSRLIALQKENENLIKEWEQVQEELKKVLE